MKEEDLWHEQKTLLECVEGKFYWDSYLKVYPVHVCVLCRQSRPSYEKISQLPTDHKMELFWVALVMYWNAVCLRHPWLGAESA